MSSQPLNFQLETYEGPLDLLLDLIRKNQVNIYDIPIARITAQYMEYMAKAAALDIELSSDFIYMAATLIHIKSKMLLPKDPALEADVSGRGSAAGTGRTAGGAPEVQGRRRDAAAEAPARRSGVVESRRSGSFSPMTKSNPGLDVSLFDLVKTFQTVLERAKNRPIYEVGKEDVNVPDMIRFLRDTLIARAAKQAISVTRIVRSAAEPRAPCFACFWRFWSW